MQYSTRDAKGHNDRDVLNEKPSREEQTLAVHETKGATGGSSPFAHAAVIHTTLGDMRMVLYPQHAPKAVENFVGHARSGYYSNVIFHRVIKKFVSTFFSSSRQTSALELIMAVMIGNLRCYKLGTRLVMERVELQFGTESLKMNSPIS